MPPAFHDAHNHLQEEWLRPHLEQATDRLGEIGLRSAVVNGTCESDWPAVSELSTRFSWVIPSFGLHPWEAGNRSPHWLEKLSSLLASHPEAGVGEIGLDRWILDRARPDDPRLAGLRRAPLDEQLGVFESQLALAARENRAVSIHCLDAVGALLDALTRSPRPARGFLLHAYSGPAEMIGAFADLGAYFSFNGAFLEERKTRQRAVFKQVPPDRLLVETDAPAMPLPQPFRTYNLPPGPEGQTLNHPANIEAIYAGLAAFLDLPVDRLAEAVDANFLRLFGPQQVKP